MAAIDNTYAAANSSYSAQDHYLEAQVYAQLGYLFFRVMQPDRGDCEDMAFQIKVKQKQFKKAQEFYKKLIWKIPTIPEIQQNGPLDDEAWL